MRGRLDIGIKLYNKSISYHLKIFFAKGKANKRELVSHTKKGNIRIERIVEKMAVRNPGKSLGLSVCPKMRCSLPELCLMGICCASS